MTKTNGTTKTTKTPKAVKTPEVIAPYTGKFTPLFGFAATRAICWMGGQGFDFLSAKQALAHFKVKGVSDSTVRVQLNHGSKGAGNPASFTKAQAAEIKRAGILTPKTKGAKKKAA